MKHKYNKDLYLQKNLRIVDIYVKCCDYTINAKFKLNIFCFNQMINK